MTGCPACGKELPGEFPFCPFCGAALAVEAPPPSLEERKVVSVLFCDLVGFTAASDAADPEDVRARIRPYHARVKEEIERYGGTVEKFIGDAVMAVFGAPVAHEDDAERAVRAGLRVLEAIAELNEADPVLDLNVRIGINTGEAVVALGARAEQGEAIVAGDVVNTASRLQSAAPVNAVAVSEQTCRHTERVFSYEELEPVQVKGKAEPLPVWRPLAARARLGADVIRTHTTPLVGRELERPLLIGTFERAAQQQSCQLVTIVGEPGVGKSRLCGELLRYVEDRPGLVRWRQGRCLPYGEGIAFWALGEIVKGQCGILESDSPEIAAAKLDAALPPDGSDRAWLKARLSPLVGAGGQPVAQEESFTAWRRFCESLAAERPAVLVFEDLHWADAALLSFLEHLADWAEGVPLLLLCTARPELYEQHPTWAAGLRNATTINLAPLTNEETAQLISTLLGQALLSANAERALLERAGGNPLYAEEFVRLLADRGLAAGAIDDVALPDSVQALIAARLDTLPPDRKSLLQDAAVVGKVFWAGAVAEMGGRDPRDVEVALHELARKELVRPARTSSMEGEAEYGFWHVLVRDVCYAQIPRAVRATRHRTAAAWIEGKAGDRVEDLADVLAVHYLEALELVRATGQSADAEELEAPARRYLVMAGERALALDVASAEASLAKALSLAPTGHPERASVLEAWGRAAQQQGRVLEAKAALEEALALFRESSEPVAAGRTLTTLTSMLGRLGDSRQTETIEEAVALLEPLPGPELVDAYAAQAGSRYVGAAYLEAIAAAERALELAERLGLDEPARALGARGGSRAYLGQRDGLADMRRALALALEQGRGRDAALLHNNLAIASWLYEGPDAALAACRDGIEFCERRGITEFASGISAMSLTFLVECGRNREALHEAEPLAARAEAAGDALTLVEARSAQFRLLLSCGARIEAAAGERLAAVAREVGDPQILALGFSAAARVLLAAGHVGEPKALLTELVRTQGMSGDPYYAALLPDLVRCAIGAQDAELAGRLTESLEPRTPLFEHALCACRAALAEAARETADAADLYAAAAERWLDFGNVPERDLALLGQGRCLLALGRPDADEPLREARASFAAIGYTPALVETEALLERALAAAS